MEKRSHTDVLIDIYYKKREQIVASLLGSSLRDITYYIWMLINVFTNHYLPLLLTDLLHVLSSKGLYPAACQKKRVFVNSFWKDILFNKNFNFLDPVADFQKDLRKRVLAVGRYFCSQVDMLRIIWCEL